MTTKKARRSVTQDAADVLNVREDFIEENKRADLGRLRHKNAPYSKEQRIARRKEVYRLHFELGMPATRVAVLMNVDRNTINADLRILYSQLKADNLNIEFGDYFVKQMIRLEAQRVRLVGYLDKAAEIETKLTVERLLAEIDTKMLTISGKVAYNSFAFTREVLDSINEIAMEKKLDTRYISPEQVLSLSPKAFKKIAAILKKEGLSK